MESAPTDTSAATASTPHYPVGSVSNDCPYFISLLKVMNRSAWLLGMGQVDTGATCETNADHHMAHFRR